MSGFSLLPYPDLAWAWGRSECPLVETVLLLELIDAQDSEADLMIARCCKELCEDARRLEVRQ